jgi:hypothetical protein
MTREVFAARIRGEYSEMPGLRLTLRQACRLWQVQADQCEATLESLVLEGFLARTRDGAFIALPAPAGRRMAKAMLSGASAARRTA